MSLFSSNMWDIYPTDEWGQTINFTIEREDGRVVLTITNVIEGQWLDPEECFTHKFNAEQTELIISIFNKAKGE